MEDPAVAVGWGYGESKWVAESILLAAIRNTPLKPVIVRPTGIAGGANGAWGPYEWIPAMFCSSVELGCFPRTEDVSV